MGRPSKSAKVIQMEKKSHRTKAELRRRQQAEDAAKTGRPMWERSAVKADREAHREYLRVRSLMRALEKDDAAFEAGVNRYALLYAECEEVRDRRDRQRRLAEIAQERIEKECRKIKDPEKKAEYYLASVSAYVKLAAAADRSDKILQSKRGMMMTFEKENLMTIASQLRSIPKKPEKKANPLREALGG